MGIQLDMPSGISFSQFAMASHVLDIRSNQGKKPELNYLRHLGRTASM